MSSEKKQYKKFRIENDGLFWENKFYTFLEIKHIFLSRVSTTQKVNFMTVGTAESIAIRLTLSNNKKIVLSFDESGLFIGFNADKKEDIKNTLELYEFIAKKTFTQRLSQYTIQIEKKGYFEYDECRFYPAEAKIIFREQVFPIETSDFLKQYGYIVLTKKNLGIFDKIKLEMTLFTKIPQFNTQTDTDVIFTLLQHYFGLTW
jgi:hypothetical protein